ncbi:MAG TPA: TetR/AcrR family transcriptional regulator [Actinokineospora sp.]|jgi:TetR/AcrR family transcriptional repressor of nem operon|nr:TetR/AcrR family transcriptional regulator [Actinokineospora sp.]
MERIDTRGALIDQATHLVRSRGYSAFSFADLAAAVGIRKASVHHHFPSKEELGIEVVARYTERFQARLAGIDSVDAVASLERYAALYREGLVNGEACLCGMIAAETAAVPPAVAAGVATFFTSNLAWLTKLIDEGQRAGDLGKRQPPEAAAAAVLAALEGAVFVARGLDDIAAFDLATATTIDLLRAVTPGGRAAIPA